MFGLLSPRPGLPTAPWANFSWPNAATKLGPDCRWRPHSGRRGDSSGLAIHLANTSTDAPFRLLSPRNARQLVFYAFACWVMFLTGCADITKPPLQNATENPQPPPAPREFRAAWIATVANIDWPSKKGLSVEQQKQEIIRVVSRAKELNLNALIFQVRPAADALYVSALEPWSEYLTGEQGKPPEPAYDPLQMWIDESHQRGIELHAWFNPYRARHTSAKSPLAKSHIANTNPFVVKEYGGYLWMDPGEAAAATRTLDVILDVVRRYDIDGVHIDDYFYPYPVPANANAPAGETVPELEFPDDGAWNVFRQSGGKLSRADWRRQNVNDLIERIHAGIHREKSWVRFGVSPFGIGRPDRRPPGIVGFSQYDKLYADVELWLAKGWMDYLVPQLYWPIDQPAQAFAPLMEYWVAQNTAKRHVWPGLFTSRIDTTARSWKPEEILNQIATMRTQKAVNGHVHFSMIALMENRQGIADQLKAAYATPALIPAASWLNNEAPGIPLLEGLLSQPDARVFNVQISAAPGKDVRQFTRWLRYGNTWQFDIVPATGNKTETRVATESAAGGLSEIRVAAVDRFGNESKSASITFGSTQRGAP